MSTPDVGGPEQAQPPTDAGAPDAPVKPGTEKAKTTFVNNMNQLKEASPELYNLVLQGLAMKIVHDMRDHADRLKRLIREGRDSRR